ncbi:MAG: type II toxin-antitoxin system HicA family toxin [Ignavibacteria bacterium]|nr:type II toxin-antitoxin system HicA family toxin [Ignavibacteria bacterium]
MAKQPRLTAKEAVKLILDAGFRHIRSKGIHKICIKDKIRIVLPFHSGQVLHPKIVKEVLTVIENE